MSQDVKKKKKCYSLLIYEYEQSHISRDSSMLHSDSGLVPAYVALPVYLLILNFNINKN